MDPVRAAIERHAESARVGDAAAADMVGGLDQREAPARGGNPARGGDAGRAGADDDDVDRRQACVTAPRAGRAASAAEAARNERRLSRGMVSGCLKARADCTKQASRANVTVDEFSRSSILRYVGTAREPNRNGL